MPCKKPKNGNTPLSPLLVRCWSIPKNKNLLTFVSEDQKKKKKRSCTRRTSIPYIKLSSQCFFSRAYYSMLACSLHIENFFLKILINIVKILGVMALISIFEFLVEIFEMKNCKILIVSMNVLLKSLSTISISVNMFNIIKIIQNII